jgi:ECF transporter S component (folate family)
MNAMKRYRTVWCTYTLVSLGALTAIYLILSRFLAINIGGFGRIQLGVIARIMAGIWFGPFAGALCGLASDLLGCLIQGYAVNPLITFAAILWGVIPALFVPQRSDTMAGAQPSVSKKAAVMQLCAGTVIACIVCTLFVTTAALVWFNGYSFYAILPTRLIQVLLQTPVYCVLVCLLYFSPITAQVNQSLQVHAGKRKAEPHG